MTGPDLLWLMRWGKIFVFGNNDGIVSERVSPDGRIIRMPKANIYDVLGDVATLCQ